MIYYDSFKHKIINIYNKDININFNTKSILTGNTRQPSRECELVIDFEHKELEYFKEWLYDINTKYAINYKRDIFISFVDKDIKFFNCYIINLELYSNFFTINLNCDFYSIGEFVELKAIHRDIKIDLILN